MDIITSLSNSHKLDFSVSAIAAVQKSQANLELLVTRVSTLEAKVSEQDKSIVELRANNAPPKGLGKHMRPDVER